MERTESIVVQVAPQFENEKIQEMQQFGWSLQGRQEIHEQGEAYGRPSYLAEFTGTYVVKTTVHHYVKLHFVRSLDVPNLPKIKGAESEYFSLPFPGSVSLVGPVIFTIIPIPGGLMGLADPLGRVSPGLVLTAFAAGWVWLGIRWIKSRRNKNAEAARTREASAARAKAIMAEMRALVA